MCQYMKNVYGHERYFYMSKYYGFLPTSSRNTFPRELNTLKPTQLVLNTCLSAQLAFQFRISCTTSIYYDFHLFYMVCSTVTQLLLSVEQNQIRNK